MLVSKAAEICGLISNTTRYNIMRTLVAAGVQGISQRQLIMKLELPRAAVKRHMAPLEKMGIVRIEKQARAVVYRADPTRISDFLDSLKRHFEPDWNANIDLQAADENSFPSLRERLDEIYSDDIDPASDKKITA